MSQTATSTSRPQYKTARRQNRSCDQCRRSKRACDAAIAQRTSCSSCVRLVKTCTFEGVFQRRIDTLSKTPFGVPANIAFTLCENTAGYHPSTSAARSTASAQSRSPEEGTVPTSTGHLLNANPITDATPHHIDFLPRDRSFPCHTNSRTSVSSNDASSSLLTDTRASLLETSFYDEPVFSDYLARDASLSRSNSNVQARSSMSSDKDSEDWRSQLTRSRHSPSRSSRASFGVDPLFLAEHTNKSLITASLDRIYCDSLENALLCWVSEQTCPYNLEGLDQSFAGTRSRSSESSNPTPRNMLRRVRKLDRSSCGLRKRPLAPRERQLAAHALHTTILAFAAQWSHLKGSGDAEFLESSHNGSSRLSEQRFGALRDASTGRIVEERLANFDRSLQEALWNEARRALQEAAGIDSAQLLFAQVIFAFTQRPVSREEFVRMLEETENPAATYAVDSPASSPHPQIAFDRSDIDPPRGSMTSPSRRTRDATPEPADAPELLGLEKLHIHMQESLLSCSAWRVRLNHVDAKQRLGNKYRDEVSRVFDEIDDDLVEDRITFNQVFWLGMMCDSLSAAIYNRLPIVSDEDSVILSKASPVTSADPYLHLGSSPDSPVTAAANVKQKEDKDSPWEQFFLRRTPAELGTNDLQWPFSAVDASVVLTEAAPVKVLLYRRIRRVQTLRFRQKGPELLEDAIAAALRVYEHWNMHFGPFITTCIQHHDELPTQTQSWYSVLTGHWNLATFMLTDLIEDLDRNGETERHRSELRKSCGLLHHIRRQSAFEMGDMGRVGRAREYGSFRETSDTHPALSDGALLTEPWTEIMVRSFSRCSEQLLAWLGEHQQIPWGDSDSDRSDREAEQLRLALHHCIEALWDIGRISDTSLLLAISLQRRLKLMV